MSHITQITAPYWEVNDWVITDKSILEARKEEWQYIQHNLKAFNRIIFAGSFLRKHKQLFFEGIADVENYGDDAFHFALPWFVMWYHPKPSVELAKKIVEAHSSSYRDAVSIANIRDLFYRVYNTAYRYLKDEYGFMGGREEYVVHALWGQDRNGALFDRVVDPDHPERGTRQGMLNSEIVGWFYWGAVRGVMRQGVKNGNSPGQYLFSHANSVVADQSNDSSGTLRSMVKMAASNALHFEKSPFTDKENPKSIQMRDKLIQMYRNGDFNPQVQEIWQKVEAGDIEFGE